MKDLDSYKDLLFEKKCFAQIAIVRKNGKPHVTPIWFNLSEEDFKNKIININTATGRVKSSNMNVGDKIALSIVDIENPYRYLGIEGTIVKRIMGEEADSHIDQLAMKYLEQEKYPYRTDTEERIKMHVKIDKIYGDQIFAVNPFTSHPVNIAGNISLLNELSKGRAYLGLARGAWLDFIGVSHAKPITALREAFICINHLLNRDKKALEAEFFPLTGG